MWWMRLSGLLVELDLGRRVGIEGLNEAFGRGGWKWWQNGGFVSELFVVIRGFLVGPSLRLTVPSQSWHGPRHSWGKCPVLPSHSPCRMPPGHYAHSSSTCTLPVLASSSAKQRMYMPKENRYYTHIRTYIYIYIIHTVCYRYRRCKSVNKI